MIPASTVRNAERFYQVEGCNYKIRFNTETSGKKWQYQKPMKLKRRKHNNGQAKPSPQLMKALDTLLPDDHSN
jgi:hypothetical protein